MVKEGAIKEASPRVMSTSIMSLFITTGVAVHGITRPLPRSLNFAMGMAGGFGSEEFVGMGREPVNETWALRDSSHVWSV